MPTVAVDVMSGDADYDVRVAAALGIRSIFPGVEIILVGDSAAIKRRLATVGADKAVVVEHADEVVAMDELPMRAVRRRNTSMRRALDLVAEGRANAAVSAGNTGALLGLGVLVLKVIEGISRPAIASFVPNRNPDASCCLLDLGANAECTPEMLRDFALMGAALVKAVKKKDAPRVALLNIGEEDFKGNKLLLDAATLLKEMKKKKKLNFVGNAEGYDVYGDRVDVIVCDGFTGNVALKVSEGLAAMLTAMLKEAFQENRTARLCGLFALPVLNKLKQRMDHRAYNGACFLGLRGVVVKSHGHADEKAFTAAIRYAIEASRQNLPTIISDSISVADTPLI